MKNKESKIFISFLKKILGYKPKNINIYSQAFIHKSASQLSSNGDILNNERLEFLGDAVIEAIISDIIFKKYPKFDEGLLTKTRSKLVNTNQLSYYSIKLNLADFLLIHTNNKLNKKHLYADSFEALIGALFLDKGFEKTYKFISNIIIDKYTDLDKILKTETNHKSKLLELSQKENFNVTFDTKIAYDNSKQFIANILINDKLISKGIGNNKKEAEQNAAFETLKIYNPEYNINNN